MLDKVWWFEPSKANNFGSDVDKGCNIIRL